RLLNSIVKRHGVIMSCLNRLFLHNARHSWKRYSFHRPAGVAEVDRENVAEERANRRQTTSLRVLLGNVTPPWANLPCKLADVFLAGEEGLGGKKKNSFRDSNGDVRLAARIIT
ncbi:hypothetical protein K0M31_013514, partial [Melipona bicolor]